MTSTTPTTEAVTITLPVVRGVTSKNTARFFEADANGEPNRDGASIWFWKQMLAKVASKNPRAQHPETFLPGKRSSSAGRHPIAAPCDAWASPAGVPAVVAKD